MLDNRVLALVIIIAILLAVIIFLLIGPKPSTGPIAETIAPPTYTNIPRPTNVPIAPTSFIPQSNGILDTGGSELLTIVNEGSSVNEIAEVLQHYTWIEGELDLTRANGLYLYNKAWAATTNNENFTYDIETDKEFLYSGLIATILMDSQAQNAFCGIRINSNGNDNYIDILLHRNGFLETVVISDGREVRHEKALVYEGDSIRTEGNELAKIYIFYDKPGLTVIANYVFLGQTKPPSQRIHIDFNNLSVPPKSGTVMLRVGTTAGITTHCQYNDFYQYPIQNS